ncbi:MAG: right-handed parallel beta-helix repeat-containing protein [Fusicatenibacter sp.]|nr:right-handed parallel beta-helix repeat-containing protein [Fusicatenibacter sp.]
MFVNRKGKTTMIYYVSQKNQKCGSGTADDPFWTISQAAQLAQPGDTIIIGEGIYREWVDPKNGGSGNNQRIIYRNAERETPVISGAEIVKDWTCQQGTVWKAIVPNSLFGTYNPYSDLINGDWFDDFGRAHHTGEVFLDGEAMYEAVSLEELMQQKPGEPESYRWFATVEQDCTVFYGNFQRKNPNDFCVEISVRPYCFFPSREGRNYITVSGITMRQAATQWAPPTGFQPGLIGPHWSKGWIIENCTISESKCVGISLGKKADVKDNRWLADRRKSGTQNYIEMIFSNINDGWNKERIGSHIVRNNEIYNCGQAGIIGNMGCAFSDIIGNHIHHINTRHELGGWEMAGIKFHSAVDAVLEGNCVHDCICGNWLDWQAQGVIVRENAFFDNGTDLYLEVSHGPCLIANNLFLSKKSFWNVSQGTACVHNLFAGELRPIPDTSRFTLYHLPHSTMVGGVMLIYGGDDRIANNIFVGTKDESMCSGTEAYQGYGEEYEKSLAIEVLPISDVNKTFPVDIHDNLYLNGAKYCGSEKNPRTAGLEIDLHVVKEDGHYYLETNLYDAETDFRAELVTTENLGYAFETEQAYEERDGSRIVIDKDFTGRDRDPQRPMVGPLERTCSRIMLI